MAQQASFVQDGVDRVREVVSSLESDFNKVQKRAERRIRAQRKETEKQVKKLQTDFRKNAYVKRAQSFADDAAKQLEKNVDSLLGALNVASQRDLRRVDRKLNQINKKLRDLEKSGPAS